MTTIDTRAAHSDLTKLRTKLRIRSGGSVVSIPHPDLSAPWLSPDRS